MRKRWWLNAGLSLVVVALVVLLWAKPHRPPPPPPPAVLTPLKAAAVTAITLVRAGHPAIDLTRRGKRWFLQKPFTARADRFRVAALTGILTAPVSDRFVAPTGATLTQYGLAPPQAVLTLNGLAIRIGARHPFAALRYVALRHHIALIPAETIHPRRLHVDGFLSTRLLGDHMHPVAFALPGFTVARRRGIWQLSPPMAHVSNDRINTFVDEWRYARALAVTRYHGQPAIGLVTIRYHRRAAGDGPRLHTLTLDILARRPELVLFRPDEGLEYHFPAEIGQRLLRLTR
ncbi:MAG: hypothetical protein ACYCXG_06580 [Acidiferrobacter sp.]